MTDLADAFGEEFAESVEEEVKKRRTERNKLTDESRRMISHLAINEGRMEGGDPRFTYKTEEGITHTVMLMQLPNPREGSAWNYVNELDSGAISMPLEYLGEWISCLFNDKDEARKLEEDEYYLVAGQADTWTNDQGEENEQLSPVRGVISLDEAKKLADKQMEQEGFGSASDEEEDDEEELVDTSDEEEEVEQEPEDDEDDDDSGGLFSSGGGDDDEEEEDEEEDEPALDATRGEVEAVVEDLAEQEPEVWDVHEDHPELETLMKVVFDRLGLDPSDEDVVEEATDIVLSRVEEEREDDEDDEEEGLF